MEKVFIIIVPVENIKDNGYMIKNMDMVWSNMLMEINIKDNGKMDKDKDKEIISILMEIFIQENGLLI